eukprot:gb/GEZN01001537.1/.p1 GENE.gb/GEZN01001537.1/~~gb/GEZN01001537.1/.p1  ORF type:complete len:482 (+),score=57.16 gb/GEZN01001537.1/:32-1477(+)
MELVAAPKAKRARCSEPPDEFVDPEGASPGKCVDPEGASPSSPAAFRVDPEGASSSECVDPKGASPSSLAAFRAALELQEHFSKAEHSLDTEMLLADAARDDRCDSRQYTSRPQPAVKKRMTEERKETMMTQEVSLQGRRLQLRLAVKDALPHGLEIWGAGLVLWWWIVEQKDASKRAHLEEADRVLELGAGCGLSALLLAPYSRVFVASDRPGAILDNLTINARGGERNRPVTTKTAGSPSLSSCRNCCDSVCCHGTLVTQAMEWQEFIGKTLDYDHVSFGSCDRSSPSLSSSSSPFLPSCTTITSSTSLSSSSSSTSSSSPPSSSSSSELSSSFSGKQLWQPFPVIVAADIMYDAQLMPALVAVLEHMLAPGGTFFAVCAAGRSGLQAFLDLIAQKESSQWITQLSRFPARELGQLLKATENNLVSLSPNRMFQLASSHKVFLGSGAKVPLSLLVSADAPYFCIEVYRGHARIKCCASR